MTHPALYIAVVIILAILGLVLPDYHHGNMTRIMLLGVYAMGYNILFGYTGLLSLGHALFFAAGMYGAGLSAQYGGLSGGPALIIGLLSGAIVASGLALLALRTKAIAFMIVTLMFAQAGYLTILYFGTWTRGDEGIVLSETARQFGFVDLRDADHRYWLAWAVFSATLLGTLWMVRRPFGRVLIAIRENEDRAVMLGYNSFRYKFQAMVLSGTLSALAGALYGQSFGYIGASFAAVPFSIFPLLWVLLGGAGTLLGPFLGVLFMFYLIDLSSTLTTAHLLIVGVVLVLVALFLPQGLMGLVRDRFGGQQ